nr:4-alpha-glucanotransferase [Rubrobacter marinus]
MDTSRSAGILLHPTSLPGPHGIGELGPEALRFVEFLKEAGQGLWQVLPWARRVRRAPPTRHTRRSPATPCS